MTTYVAMLRGINVSGRNPLPMEDLRHLVTGVGGKDVQTYIQSGNAVFRSAKGAAALTAALEAELEKALGGHIPVLVRTGPQLAAVVAATPFGRRRLDPKTLHVTFLGAAPAAGAVAAVSGPRADDDELVVVGREVYLHCPHGYGTSKLTNAFFEKKFATEATTRNWTTVGKLVAMAGT